MTEGQTIRFHGGWNHEGVRCEICKFSCVVIERYQIWDQASQRFVLHSNDLWVARLETGSYVVGYPEQFEAS
jgi:hypothetical protein